MKTAVEFSIYLLLLVFMAVSTQTNKKVVNSPAELQTTLDTALPGDVIALGPYIFSGEFVVSRSGTQDAPITLLTHASKAKLVGRGGKMGVGLTITGNFITVRYIALRDFDVGVLIKGKSVKLDALSISDVNNGVVVEGDGAALNSNAVENAKDVGIQLGHVRQSILSANSVQGDNLAVEANKGASGGALTDNVFFGKVRVDGTGFTQSGNVIKPANSVSHNEDVGFFGSIANWFRNIG